MCERVVYDIIYDHVRISLSPAQSGFCRGDSTRYQVTRLVQDIHTARNAHNHVGLVFFDLAKAFDTVWHRGLLAKLRTVYRIIIIIIFFALLLLLLLLLIKRNGVRRNNTYENDNPSTKVITGKTAKALNELVKTTSIL